MARVLFISSPERGHVNPLVAVAQHLRAAGHPVGWLCLPEAAPQLRALDVELLELPPDIPVPPLVRGGSELALIARDPGSMRQWLQAVLLDGVAAQVEPVRQLIRAFRPDVIGLDPTVYPGFIAAQLEGVPFAGLSCSLAAAAGEGDGSELAAALGALASARRALFASFGLSPRFALCDALAPWTAIFAPRELLAGATLPENVELLGPSEPLGPRGDEPKVAWDTALGDEPFVYLAFGTRFGWQPRRFAKVAEVLARRAVPLVLSAGLAPHARGLQGLPGRVVALADAPQRAVLARAALFISHGGPCSTMEGLAAGVPMLFSPICHDQPFHAAIAERSGAGLVLDLDTITTEDLDTAVGALLEPGSRYRHAASRMAQLCRATNGAKVAADRLLALGRG